MIIIYTRSDGGINFEIPNRALKLPGEGEETFVLRVTAKAIPSWAQNLRIIDEADAPADRFFRDAWVVKGAKVEVDLPRAKVIAKSRTETKDHSVMDAATTPEELKAAVITAKISKGK